MSVHQVNTHEVVVHNVLVDSTGYKVQVNESEITVTPRRAAENVVDASTLDPVVVKFMSDHIEVKLSADASFKVMQGHSGRYGVKHYVNADVICGHKKQEVVKWHRNSRDFSERNDDLFDAIKEALLVIKDPKVMVEMTAAQQQMLRGYAGFFQGPGVQIGL